MLFRDINYLHIRSVSLTILPRLSYRAEGSVGVVKFATLKVQKHCRKWLLQKKKKFNKLLIKVIKKTKRNNQSFPCILDLIINHVNTLENQQLH